MSYICKLSGTMADHLGEIQRHLNRNDPTMNHSVASLIDYAIDRTIQEFRQNPAKLLTDYQTYREQKTHHRQI